MAIQVVLSGLVLSDLKNYDSVQEGMVYGLMANTAIGDRSYRMYYYNASSTATPDDDNVIENVVLGGRYFKMPTEVKITTTGSGVATFNATTGVLNIPPTSLPTPTIATPTRSLNSNFTISTTKSADVAYSVSLSATNPLLAGSSSASVFLEYSQDAGVTWKGVCQSVNLSSVALTVTVTITSGTTAVLCGCIPANALCRLRSTVSGTASATFISAQEVTY